MKKSAPISRAGAANSLSSIKNSPSRQKPQAACADTVLQRSAFTFNNVVPCKAESIEGVRERNGQVFYRVKWSGEAWLTDSS